MLISTMTTYLQMVIASVAYLKDKFPYRNKALIYE